APHETIEARPRPATARVGLGEIADLGLRAQQTVDELGDETPVRVARGSQGAGLGSEGAPVTDTDVSERGELTLETIELGADFRGGLAERVDAPLFGQRLLPPAIEALGPSTAELRQHLGPTRALEALQRGAPPLELDHVSTQRVFVTSQRGGDGITLALQPAVVPVALGPPRQFVVQNPIHPALL